MWKVWSVKGSTFRITLKLCDETALATFDHASDELVTRGGEQKGKRIVYVEDNPANLKLVTEIISELTDYELKCAETGQQGLDLIVDEEPDLILLDINLPEMSGFEILKELRGNHLFENTPIIALTANAMEADVQRGKEAGFDDYISKPIIVPDLLVTLKEYMPG